MKIEIQLNHYDIKVMINGLPHIVIDRKAYIGFQAYTDDDKMSVIEFYTKTNKIKAEYDDIKKWEQILKELNKL
jgi:hypothetical protein